MFCTEPVEIAAAKKAHVCTWCGQAIEAGQPYRRWTSFDDCAFVNKMHPECVGACHEECRYYGDNEYIAYEGERPAAALSAAPTDTKENNDGR